MSDYPPLPAGEQGTHFWFMTIQTQNARGHWMGSYQGVLTPEPEETRLELFNSIRDDIFAGDPRARGGVVLAFDLQPNQV